MSEAPKDIWVAALGRWYANKDMHPLVEHYTRADLAFPKDVAEEMLTALKEAEIWLSPEPLQTCRAAIAKAEAALKGE